MENLWKLHDMGYRLNNVDERAEYDRLVKRFQEEEEKTNMKNLLFEGGRLVRPTAKTEKDPGRPRKL